MRVQALLRNPAATMLQAWAALLALGTVFVMSQPFLAAPLSAAGKRAAKALINEPAAVEIWDAVALGGYASIVLGTPVVLLAALVRLERIVSGTPPRRNGLIWTAHALFFGVMGVFYMLFYVLDLLPKPVLAPDRGAGPLLHSLQALLLFIGAIMLRDLFQYWIHRAMHRFPWLWRFHAIHHSHDLDVLRGIKHPLDSVVTFLLASVPAALLIRVSAFEFTLLSAFFVMQGYILHMRAPVHLGPLGALLCDNRYHFLHHNRDPAIHNCNFADHFPFIDKLFGTYHAPVSELPETGLFDRRPPETLRGYALAILPPTTTKLSRTILD